MGIAAEVIVVLSLRGAAAVFVLLAFAGGLPRLVQVGLAAAVGLWAASIGAGVSTFDVSAMTTVELALVGGREVVIGATLGIVAVVPLMAAATAAHFVEVAGGGRGVYRGMVGVLAAAVFVGIDGHVVLVTTIVESFRDVPAIGTTPVRVLDALGRLIANALRLALPWLVTAAVVEVAVGVGMRIAGRAGAMGTPASAPVPAALAMMTATLIATFALVLAALVRGTL